MMRMPRLGRSVRVTLGLAITLLVAIYGGMEVWPRVETYWQMRSLDRDWHDAGRSPAARAKAAEMLAEYGPEATPYLLAAARDADGGIRETAYNYLGSLEPVPEEAVQICLAAVKSDSEPRARGKAAMALGAVAYTCRQGRLDRRRVMLASLVEAGRDTSPIVRRDVVRAMVGAQAAEIDLGPWLEDADRSVRLAAAEAVLWLDPAHRQRAVPTLQAMVLQAGPDHPGELVRSMDLLIRADPSACRGLVPTFISWLRHDDDDARARVIRWLGNLGPMAREATPALEAMLDGGRTVDRILASAAIIRVDPAGCHRAVGCLVTVLADAAISPRHRGATLQPLRMMFRHPHVPAPIRDRALRDMRIIPDQPDIHPELARGIRQLVEALDNPPSPSPGSPRLISNRSRGMAVPGVVQ
jgi:HEAT repeat protein